MTDALRAVDSYRLNPRGRRNVTPQRAPRAVVSVAWHQHQDLLRNVGSLVATTGVTSGLGAVYWTISARLFSQQDVGYGAAEVSIMTLLGTIGMLGLGTLLIAELPRRNQRAGLISVALIASALGSLLLGLGFLLIAPYFSGRFADILGTPEQGALFTLGVMFTGVSQVVDLATIGLMRGGIQLSRNIVFCTTKLIALPAAAFILHNQLGIGIASAWVGGLVLSLAVVAISLRVCGTSLLVRPDWRLLRSLGGTAMAHNWLNIAMMVPPTVIPVLVTVLVSPSANAAFYIAFMLSGFLYVVPTHLGTVLFAVAAAEPRVMAQKIRFALRLSYLVGLPGVAILILGGHWALSVYGPGYARIATVPMWLLALGYLPSVPRLLYIAVCRASGRIVFAATILTAFTIAEVAGTAAAAATNGLMGLSLALLAVFIVEGAVTTPSVLRAAIGRGRHRHADSLTITTANPATRKAELRHKSTSRTCDAQRFEGQSRSPIYPPHGQQRYLVGKDTIYDPTLNQENTSFHPIRDEGPSREQQNAGIAALIAIANATGSTVSTRATLLPSYRTDKREPEDGGDKEFQSYARRASGRIT